MKRLIRGIYREVRGKRILDVSMGKWSLVKELFPELYVVGIDRVPPLFPPDEFHIADVKEDLPFKDGEFVLVFAGEIIEHLGSQSAYHLLKEIFRVLQNNSYLLLTTPNAFRSSLKRILRRPTVAVHVKEFSFIEINRFLVEIGFNAILSEGIQPLFIPWSWAARSASMKLPGLMSSQLIFLCRKL